MNWIKVQQYLPGNNRIIQIWNKPPYEDFEGQPTGNHSGYYLSGQWYSLQGGILLHHVTHWSEMLDAPDEFKNEKTGPDGR